MYNFHDFEILLGTITKHKDLKAISELHIKVKCPDSLITHAFEKDRIP